MKLTITLDELASFIFRDGERIPVRPHGIEFHPAWDRNSVIPATLAEQILAIPGYELHFKLYRIDHNWYCIWHSFDWAESWEKRRQLLEQTEPERLKLLENKEKLFRLDEMASKISKRSSLKKADLLTTFEQMLDKQGEAALADFVSKVEQILGVSFYIPPSET